MMIPCGALICSYLAEKLSRAVGLEPTPLTKLSQVRTTTTTTTTTATTTYYMHTNTMKVSDVCES